ncbi:MAG: Holliday junction resolvase RuvX [Candidatus Marinimicrobia bacterium]|nr:Holliday junction resolvase RuvX [Candidatus Neomarinimicrobiota bacterium]
MGRILGIDYGLKRIGLALSDPLHIIASPYKTISGSDEADILQKLRDIISEESVSHIVVGLPIGMKGQETEQTKLTRVFADSLNCFGLPIFLQDERLSSVSAKKSLIEQNIKTGYNKALIDKRAAAILLQQFMDINQL